MNSDEHDFLISLEEEIIEDEGFSSVAYIPVKGDVPTIGYGFTKGVKIGDTITRDQADIRLRKEILERLRQISHYLPDFPKYPHEVRREMFSSWYRGSLSGSPKTRGLINEGKFAEASIEFLNNREYKTAIERGRRGIRRRMEETSRAIASLEESYKKGGGVSYA